MVPLMRLPCQATVGDGDDAHMRQHMGGEGVFTGGKQRTAPDDCEEQHADDERRAFHRKHPEIISAAIPV
jgi:hypothetical protein